MMSASDLEKSDRQMRADARRKRMVITRCTLEDSDVDPDPIFGAEAMSLAAVLTRESWSFSGQAFPDYSRSETPYRFIKYPSE